MRFPTISPALPGIPIDVRMNMPINEQLAYCASEYLGHGALLASHIDVAQDFVEIFPGEDGSSMSLYVASLHFRHGISDLSWPTMPQLLRTMPSNRTRLPYLKAWQLLLGGMSGDTKVVEVEDMLKLFTP